MVKLGVQKDQVIVVYDSHPLGLFGAPRCAWMLKYFGAQNVRILNGGLKKWRAEGREVAEGGEGLGKEYKEEDGNYSYGVEDASICITDIAQIHKLAATLYPLESPD